MLAILASHNIDNIGKGFFFFLCNLFLGHTFNKPIINSYQTRTFANVAFFYSSTHSEPPFSHSSAKQQSSHPL
jgi:hypothetical protein